MKSKTDKEDKRRDDFAFLSEIIADFRFWQVSSFLQVGFYQNSHNTLSIKLKHLWIKHGRQPLLQYYGADQEGNMKQARDYLTKALAILDRLGTLVEPEKVRNELSELRLI